MKAVVTMLCVAALATTASATLLSNGDFSLADLGAGQSLPDPGGYKAVNIDPSHAGYLGSVEAVTNWLNKYHLDNGVRADLGLGRNIALGGDTEQFAQMNWWNGRLSQTVADTVAEGANYDASIEIALDLDNPDQARAGRFQLWAGAPDPADPDAFPGDAILLAELVAGNDNWADPVDVTLADETWTTLNLSYTAGAGDPAIGKPLTVSFRTEWGSAGPTYWDNAVLTPEPTALALLLAGFLALRRR
jgi:hypothetical protein